MLKRLAPLLYAMCAALTLSAAEPLCIEGSSTLFETLSKALKSYDPHVVVKGGGSEQGLKALRDGTCDIAMMSRALTDDERAEGLRAYAIGYDGIALITNTAVPVNGLDETSITHIFNGFVTNWKEAGGPSAPITVVARDSSHAERQQFDRYFHIDELHNRTLHLGSNYAALIYIASTPDAVGYTSLGLAMHAMKKGLPVKIIGFGNEAPVVNGKMNPGYPLMRELNLVIKDPGTPEIQAVIDFMLSNDGQGYLTMHHLTGVRP